MIVYEKNWVQGAILTIVIPTYDREENLLLLLKHLSKCADPLFAVIVVDNLSPNGIDEELINKCIGDKLSFRMYRNKYHLGPDASLLRALELNESPWVYLLGDSKVPTYDFFVNFLQDTQNHPDVSSIVYSFDRVLTEERLIESFDQLIKSRIKFGDLFLGGNTILSNQALKKYMPLASQMTLTRSMLTIFNVMSLVEGRKILFSEKKIMQTFLDKPKHYDPKLSLLECWAQFGLLVMLPIGIKESKLLNRLILKNEKYRDYWIFIKFSLLCMFRKKTDIRKNLKLIINYRYSFVNFSVEKFFIYPLYWISVLLGITKYLK